MNTRVRSSLDKIMLKLDCRDAFTTGINTLTVCVCVCLRMGIG